MLPGSCRPVEGKDILHFAEHRDAVLVTLAALFEACDHAVAVVARADQALELFQPGAAHRADVDLRIRDE